MIRTGEELIHFKWLFQEHLRPGTHCCMVEVAARRDHDYGDVGRDMQDRFVYQYPLRHDRIS